MPKKGLGKGLGSLFSETDIKEVISEPSYISYVKGPPRKGRVFLSPFKRLRTKRR